MKINDKIVKTLGAMAISCILIFGVYVPYYMPWSSGKIEIFGVNMINDEFYVEVSLNYEVLSSFYFNHSDILRIDITGLPRGEYDIILDRGNIDPPKRGVTAGTTIILDPYHDSSLICYDGYSVADLAYSVKNHGTSGGQCEGFFESLEKIYTYNLQDTGNLTEISLQHLF